MCSGLLEENRAAVGFFFEAVLSLTSLSYYLPLPETPKASVSAIFLLPERRRQFRAIAQSRTSERSTGEIKLKV